MNMRTATLEVRFDTERHETVRDKLIRSANHRVAQLTGRNVVVSDLRPLICLSAGRLIKRGIARSRDCGDDTDLLGQILSHNVNQISDNRSGPHTLREQARENLLCVASTNEGHFTHTLITLAIALTDSIKLLRVVSHSLTSS